MEAELLAQSRALKQQIHSSEAEKRAIQTQVAEAHEKLNLMHTKVRRRAQREDESILRPTYTVYLAHPQHPSGSKMPTIAQEDIMPLRG
eukprot:732623-Pyramimonas_sp.AAC.1